MVPNQILALITENKCSISIKIPALWHFRAFYFSRASTLSVLALLAFWRFLFFSAEFYTSIKYKCSSATIPHDNQITKRNIS
jgi:hypothetical protein